MPRGKPAAGTTARQREAVRFDARLGVLGQLPPDAFPAWASGSRSGQPSGAAPESAIPDGWCQFGAVEHLPATAAGSDSPLPDQGAGGAVATCQCLLSFSGSASDLEAAGCIVRAREGSIFAALVPLPMIAALLQQPDAGGDFSRWVRAGAVAELAASRVAAMQQIGLSGAGETLCGDPVDPATLADRPPRLIAGLGSRLDDRTPTGRGVTLVIIDNGIDAAHPDFQPRAAGQPPRLIGLLDTRVMPDPTANWPAGAAGHGGRFLDAAALTDLAATALTMCDRPSRPDLSLACDRLEARASGFAVDPTGLWRAHGSAVASIAAGSGRSLPDATGLAPDAALFGVIAGRHDDGRLAETVDIAVGFATAAATVATPMVVNFSNGDGLGPHDGSLLGERLIDDLLLRPGRAVVVSAGNENASAERQPGRPPQPDQDEAACAPPNNQNIYRRHIAMTASKAGATELRWRFDNNTSRPDAIDVVVRSSSMPEAAITYQPDLQPTPAAIDQCLTIEPAPRSGIGVPVRRLMRADGGNHTIYASLTRLQRPEEWLLAILLEPSLLGDGVTDTLRAGTWTLRFRQVTGTVHGWIDRNNRSMSRWLDFEATAGRDSMTLGAPATARRVLSVGAIGTPFSGAPAGDDRDRIAFWSSRGPTRDGRHKPDLCAVGEHVLAAAPADPAAHHAAMAQAAMPPRRTAQYTQFSATSAAAPQVSGTAALLFEQFGAEATWADIRQALLETARRHALVGVQLDALPPEAGMRATWDPAFGFGRIDAGRAIAPEGRAGDVWFRKSTTLPLHGDSSREPCVAATLWDSPDIETTRHPDGRVAIRVTGWTASAPAGPVRIRLFWAPLGAVHPLPGTPTSPWRDTGLSRDGEPGSEAIATAVAAAADAPDRFRLEAKFGWQPPTNLPSGFALLACLDAEPDRYEPAATIGMRNNIAVRCFAATSFRGARGATFDPGHRFTVVGSDDTDSLMLWVEDMPGAPSLADLPLTALPWRSVTLFTEDPDQRLANRERPHFGQLHWQRDDPANDVPFRPAAIAGCHGMVRRLGSTRLAVTSIPWVTELTDIEQAAVVEIESAAGTAWCTVRGVAGQRLWIPRLRVAAGATIRLQVLVDAAGPPSAGRPGRIQIVHFSGGRRVGGGTITVSS